MPTTRKKVIKTVYKDEHDSESDGDFSDSGSEAQISEPPSSEEEEVSDQDSSGDDFKNKNKRTSNKATKKPMKGNFTKKFMTKLKKQSVLEDSDDIDVTPTLFSVKDLTESDKLLPSVLNLSESDSSDDESQTPRNFTKKFNHQGEMSQNMDTTNSDSEIASDYKDVWSNNTNDTGEEIAKKAFLELEQHKVKIEETKVSFQSYSKKMVDSKETDVKDLLALGEEVPETIKAPLPSKRRKQNDDSDAEMDDWEEVKETKTGQGLQLVVDFPNAVCKKKKKVDVEMMMKRKINRVKKEYQVYMHKVHVLCWLGYGNHISMVLNNQDVLAAALSLVPSKECYPGDRVDMKYVEQITEWYRDKLMLKQDKHEDKFRPKAPPLKDILLSQIKKRTVSTKKYLVFIFVSMLRALGLQCRVMCNFVTVPIKPPMTELCSLSLKKIDGTPEPKKPHKTQKKTKSIKSIKQVDGNYDSMSENEISKPMVDNIMQVDGNDDAFLNTRKTRSTREKNKANEVSPSKSIKKIPSQKSTNKKSNPLHDSNSVNIGPKTTRLKKAIEDVKDDLNQPSKKTVSTALKVNKKDNTSNAQSEKEVANVKVEHVSPAKRIKTSPSPRPRKKLPSESEGVEGTNVKTRKGRSANKKNVDIVCSNEKTSQQCGDIEIDKCSKLTRKRKNPDLKTDPPLIVITNNENISSAYFEKTNDQIPNLKSSRKRSHTANPPKSQSSMKLDVITKSQARSRSKPESNLEKSKYFVDNDQTTNKVKKRITRNKAKNSEDEQRVSHRDLAKQKAKPQNDVTDDLVDIIKSRVREARSKTKKKVDKGKSKEDSDDDSDRLSVESPKRCVSNSDDDFKPKKISPKPVTSRKIDRRVLSSDDDTPKNRIDVWCEVFVEELEQWIPIDVVRAKVHCSKEIYNIATHPVCYCVGWDNNNYLKDVTRRYVPHWNTVTRKQRVEPEWWIKAIKPWLSPRNARDREEDEKLDRMQLEAPLPKSISEYKNHPLYALQRHLLKFEAIYPPDAATLGFVRNEPVYARECVYTCRSRDTWLKEAKVVKLGEKPYKVVKARPKWDRLSNKLITDKPLEVFGSWQVQDYEPPEAENGLVPRNAYGNVEMFKPCMLPKGTVHIKLPGLNKVARKLNIDCAPAMTGFDFNGGWTHPVYDGFIVCKEFEEVITEAWLEDQEEQERKEREKTDARVYGNWKRLIKGLLIKERLKHKYGFENPTVSNDKKTKNKGPRLVVKKGN